MQLGMFFFLLLSAFRAAAGDACPPEEIVKFAELSANPHLYPCQNVSAGFSMDPPMGYPTNAQVKAMCASEACRALIKDVIALKPMDCYLSFAGVKLNAYKMASSFKNYCKLGTEKDHEDDKHHPTPKPTDDKHHPTPKPTVNKEHYLTPKPSKYDEHYPTAKPTEGGKYYPTPKPTKDNERHPTPKATNGTDHFKLDEPMIVRNGQKDKFCLRHCARNGSSEDAGELEPPMNSTSLELFPMPNTTYKITVPESSSKA